MFASRKESHTANFRRPSAGVAERARPGADYDDPFYDDEDDPRGSADPSSRATFTELTGRVSRWFQGLDREPEDAGYDAADPIAELGWPDPADEAPESHRDDDEPPAFPLAPFGYNRVAVDQRLDELERRLDERDRQLADLRDRERPPSITEEIERIGEQTASILVVAHDQAHETTRRAQEQAERCIADAAANAVAITAEAKERLRELDDETEAVWRERERLLQDARAVSDALAALVEDASRRFPAEDRGAAQPVATYAGPLEDDAPTPFIEDTVEADVLADEE